MTNAADVARWMTSENAADATFSLCAKTTCLLRDSDQMTTIVVADDSGCVAVRNGTADMPADLRPGDVLQLDGTLAVNFAQFEDARFQRCTRLRHETPDEPVQPDIARLLSGECDWRYARVTGIVRDVRLSETSTNWVILLLACEGRVLYVSVPLNGRALADFGPLVGCTVALRGFVTPRDGSIRTYVGRVFQCPDLSMVETLSGADDPFSAPPLFALRSLRPVEIAAFGRVRTAGRVVTVWGGSQFLIRRPTGETVRADCRGTPPPVRGDAVEVVGFPLSNLFHITLTHAHWRPTTLADVSEPPPRAISARDVLVEERSRLTAKINLQGRTVRLSGRVRSLPDPDIGPGILLVEDDSFIVPVDVSAVSEAVGHIREGCRLSVTGTCILETENWRTSLPFPQITGFRIVANEPGGIVITDYPPWWTVGRLTAVIGALFAALVGIFIWNRALNRLAERRGRQIYREQIGRERANLKAEERTRLAVELHDSLAQNLTGVSMEIETAERCGPANADGLMRHLSIADKALKSCRNDLRNTLWDLRNQALDERDMAAAVRRTLLPHIMGVTLLVRCSIPRHRLTDNVAHEVLRIVRELALNGIRHGGATEIRIAGSLDGETLRFSVADNGSGFDPDAAPGVTQGHFGLQGVRERLRGIAGRLDFAPAPTKGMKATVTIRLPNERKERPS